MEPAHAPEKPTRSDEAYREEERRVRRLQRLIDLTGSLILQPSISYEEAVALADLAKREALLLFPEKEEAFDLIYRPRLNRLLNEKMAAENFSP
ncbi:MAG: hypothetical protein HYY65_08775 [Candidatus Tectomicrobia bacterium]|uniref:Uncharacterized protein n=1 Tax=Tectimicrobiota bacterium TaxID=2528274 RepID=A0A932GQ66_UNCTE|nr:hypothetical protein [Candidatus Tectomicrobia bacterium]